MPVIHIIQKTPGPTTTEKVLEVIQSHKGGVTLKQLSHTLNRSVSMLQRCLKILIAKGLVHTQLSDNGMQLIYYPTSTSKEATGIQFRGVEDSGVV